MGKKRIGPAIEQWHGNDIVAYRWNPSNETGAVVDLNVAAQQTSAAWGTDTLLNVEHVIGSIWNDVIIGNDGDNFIQGFQREVVGYDPAINGNRLFTGTNNDTVNAGAGDDTLNINNTINGWNKGFLNFVSIDGAP